MYPETLKIFLTKKCNFKCSYCFVSKNEPEKEISLERICKAVKWFLSLPGNFKKIDISGGEPLLKARAVKEIFNFAIRNKKNRELCLSLTTNGTRLDKDLINFIKKNNVDVCISLDGTKRFHDKNRKFKNSSYKSTHQVILKTIQLLQNKGISPKVSLVFTPANYKSLLTNLNFLKKLKFKCIDYYPLLYFPWEKEQIKKLQSIFRNFNKTYITNNNSHNSFLTKIKKSNNTENNIKCDLLILGWDGKFYLCDKVFSLTKKERESFIIGDINNGVNFKKRSIFFREIKNKLKLFTINKCDKCKFSKYCFCPIGHYIYFSKNCLDLISHFESFCEISKLYLRNFINMKTSLMNF